MELFHIGSSRHQSGRNNSSDRPIDLLFFDDCKYLILGHPALKQLNVVNCHFNFNHCRSAAVACLKFVPDKINNHCGC